MTIASPSFQENSFIPKKFTCQGENTNPELRFGAVPEEAKSMALIMHDPDAPMPGGFTHWVIWNIAPLITAIKEKSAPPGASEGKNGAGKTGYIGPCPPSGTHRYFFKLYALDAILSMPADTDKNSLEAEINRHLLAEAELIGLYQR